MYLETNFPTYSDLVLVQHLPYTVRSLEHVKHPLCFNVMNTQDSWQYFAIKPLYMLLRILP